MSSVLCKLNLRCHWPVNRSNHRTVRDRLRCTGATLCLSQALWVINLYFFVIAMGLLRNLIPKLFLPEESTKAADGNSEVTENVAESAPLSPSIFFEKVMGFRWNHGKHRNREYGGGYISKKDAKTDSSKSRKKTKRPREESIVKGRKWKSQLYYQILLKN